MTQITRHEVVKAQSNEVSNDTKHSKSRSYQWQRTKVTKLPMSQRTKVTKLSMSQRTKITKLSMAQSAQSHVPSVCLFPPKIQTTKSDVSYMMLRSDKTLMPKQSARVRMTLQLTVGRSVLVLNPRLFFFSFCNFLCRILTARVTQMMRCVSKLFWGQKRDAIPTSDWRKSVQGIELRDLASRSRVSRLPLLFLWSSGGGIRPNTKYKNAPRYVT
jgi:hypothetical protein